MKVAEVYETQWTNAFMKYFQPQRLNKKHFLKSLELNQKIKFTIPFPEHSS